MSVLAVTIYGSVSQSENVYTYTEYIWVLSLIDEGWHNFLSLNNVCILSTYYKLQNSMCSSAVNKYSIRNVDNYILKAYKVWLMILAPLLQSL